MEKKTKKRIFDINFLNQTIAKFNATLIGNYENINYRSLIKFKCSCNNDETIEKRFSIIVDKTGGAKCKKCIKIQTDIRKKQTYLTRYGEDNPSKIKEFQEKKIKTFIQKYGVSNPCKNEIIKEKIINTNIIKYGSKCPLNNITILNKAKKTLFKNYGVYSSFQSNIIKDKIKDTFNKKYGVNNPFKSKIIKDKIKDTNYKKYGVNYPMQSKNILNKAYNTIIKNYGVKYLTQNKIIKEKILKTNIERYGVENPMQNKDIQIKTEKNSKRFKEYKMPSGEIRKVQGYEPYALDELLKLYSEEQIITKRKDIPHIIYYDNEKKHYYYPDIYIPHENKIIEVKSTWTIKLLNSNIDKKSEATKDAGYKYEIWCYDNKKNKIIY